MELLTNVRGKSKIIPSKFRKFVVKNDLMGMRYGNKLLF